MWFCQLSCLPQQKQLKTKVIFKYLQQFMNVYVIKFHLIAMQFRLPRK